MNNIDLDLSNSSELSTLFEGIAVGNTLDLTGVTVQVTGYEPGKRLTATVRAVSDAEQKTKMNDEGESEVEDDNFSDSTTRSPALEVLG